MAVTPTLTSLQVMQDGPVIPVIVACALAGLAWRLLSPA